MGREQLAKFPKQRGEERMAANSPKVARERMRRVVEEGRGARGR